MRLPSLPADAAVSVVVPARHAADHLPAAVASALGQDHPGPVEVVVAVGPSADRTEEVAADLARRHPEVHVVDNPTGTTPAALNAALAASSGDVVVRLDAHAQLPAGYVGRAVELLRETGAANVGGMQVPVATRGFALAVAAAMASPLGSGGARYRVGGEPGDVDTVYLGVFHRDALEEVGGFDETLTRNQDYELNHRLREAGYRVYFHPDLAVRYRPRGTLRGLVGQYVQYGAWKRQVVRLHPRSVKLRQLVPPAVVLALEIAVVVSVITGDWSVTGLVGGGYLLTVFVGALHGALTYEPPVLTREPPVLTGERPVLTGERPVLTGEPPTGTGPTPAGGEVPRVRLLAGVPAIAAALATMHLSWGVGFLVGGLARR